MGQIRGTPLLSEQYVQPITINTAINPEGFKNHNFKGNDNLIGVVAEEFSRGLEGVECFLN